MAREYVIVNDPEPAGLRTCYARRDSYPAGQTLIATCADHSGFTGGEVALLGVAGYSKITAAQAKVVVAGWDAAILADHPGSGGL